ncbi:hypothetical protein CCAND93_1860001 [Capnocytophaga canis]|uniref:Uncharacterized protein n=1 Tax=Capnocytophaga canis TaxID=1848903 RepID=A0A0B7IP76_9FLAO|nr:hypothetical protein CCAND93_1860001 [Capnocytophaga canis]
MSYSLQREAKRSKKYFEKKFAKVLVVYKKVLLLHPLWKSS